MNPMELEALQTVLLSVVGAVTFLATVLLVSRAWSKRALSQRDTARLVEALDTLNQGVEDVRADLSDVHDRLEFTERLLTRVAEGQGGTQLTRET